MKTNNELQKLKDKTFILSLTVNRDEIQKEYGHVLEEVQSEFETKGFRKGKVPLDVVKQQISPEKLTEEVVTHLISHLYSHKVQEYGLKPIIQPQVKIKNPPLTLDKEWQIEITSTELPEIEINNNAFEEVKKINTSKDKKDDKKSNKVDDILDVVVKNSQVELPSILIDADLENHLSHLVEQTAQAGLTVVQYLKNKNLTLEQYRDSLKTQIQKEWTINLAIDKIARDQKLEISKEEVESLLAKNPQMSNNINLVYYLLTQQKVFEYLENLK